MCRICIESSERQEQLVILIVLEILVPCMCVGWGLLRLVPLYDIQSVFNQIKLLMYLFP